ncbi:MAG: MBL fold metallo-hydrolase [Lawsonibacter sp.]|jgi:competence protein ComEC
MKRQLAWFFALFMLLSGCTDTAGQPVEKVEGNLQVHYLDVGQADAALVCCEGQYMLIDGGNAEDSDQIYAYLDRLGVEELVCMVATHAHEDHVGGLSGALNRVSVDMALCPVTENDTKVFENMVHYLDQQGKTLTVPEPGDTFSLGDAQVEILGPVAEYDQANNTSIVLRIDYGTTSFLFTGDMEETAEEDLIAAGSDLSATVLKVGHHGSDTSTSLDFLDQVQPEYAVISVGEDNSYGHPSQTVLSRLEEAQVQVFRTDLQGTVVAMSDGESVTFQTQRTLPIQEEKGETQETPDTAQSYVGNTNSKKFHLPDCTSVEEMKVDNQMLFSTREEAIQAGYTPCQRCNPRRRKR